MKVLLLEALKYISDICSSWTVKLQIYLQFSVFPLLLSGGEEANGKEMQFECRIEERERKQIGHELRGKLVRMWNKWFQKRGWEWEI